MNTNFYGFTPNDLSVLNKATKFFSEILGISGEDICVDIHCVDVLQSTGACHQNNSEDFMISLKGQAIGHMVVTLAHELTHVKQYRLDSLGEKLDFSIPYSDRWWEQEAYDFEVWLCQLFLKFINVTKGMV